VYIYLQWQNIAIQELNNNFLVLNFSECLALRDTSLSSYSCMLIHSCLLADPTICLDQLVETGPGQTLIIAILDYLIQEDNEWG